MGSVLHGTMAGNIEDELPLRDHSASLQVSTTLTSQGMVSGILGTEAFCFSDDAPRQEK